MKLRYAILEEDYPDGLTPFSLTRPSSMLVYRHRRISDWLREALGEPEGFVAPERFFYFGLRQPSDYDLLVSSMVRPEMVREAVDEVRDGESLWERGHLVVSRGPPERTERREARGTYLIRGPWELTKSLRDPPFDRSRIEGEIGRFVSIVERDGPVIIERGAVVEDFTVIKGPAFISQGSRVYNAQISGSYVGRWCRVSGEVERSVIDDYAHKAHFGFVGDSYVGIHANLGAGTTTSNLKNTYGTVRVMMGKALVDTGEIKVGAFIGDFARTSINTSIMSGKMIGAFSYAGGTVSSDVEPFMFYDRRMNLDRLIEQLGRYMERRNIPLDEGLLIYVRSTYERFLKSLRS
ncbi:MAG: hypothetical protein ACP5LW_01110 [Nitrososphaeria archaeon]